MLKANLMSPISRHKIAMAVVIALVLAVLSASALYAYRSVSHSGTVGGVNWGAFDSIDYGESSGSYSYNGVSITQAAQPIHLRVESVGRELCGGLFWWDTDWDVSYWQNNATAIIALPPSGSALAGQCAWFGGTYVSNYAYHQALNGSQSAGVTMEARERLPS